MGTISSASPAPVLPPPRSDVGVIGWTRANLFSAWHSSLITALSVTALGLGLWFGLRWVFFQADWTVVVTLGGADDYRPIQHRGGLPRAGLLLAPTSRAVDGHGVVGDGVGKSSHKGRPYQRDYETNDHRGRRNPGRLRLSAL